MSNSRHVLIHLHPPKKFMFNNSDTNDSENKQIILAECRSSVILYMNQLKTLNSHFREPKKHNLIYIPARHFTVNVTSDKKAINMIVFTPLIEYFKNIGYNLIAQMNDGIDNDSKSFKFECMMNLSSNLSNFHQQTANIDSYRHVTFIEVTDLKIDILFEATVDKNFNNTWLSNGINELFRNYINSLLISLLEPNYPIIFDKGTRVLLKKHISTIPHLTTIKIPMSFIFKTLSFETIVPTTTFSKLLNIKIKKLPI
ncbi:hypothetical protein ACO0SA_004529 [Hanseniaspora valbyensis]